MDSVLKITRTNPRYWRATFDSPPSNVWGLDNFLVFTKLLDELEEDDDVRVIVFDSASRDFFIAHYGMKDGPSIPTEVVATWPSLVRRLASLPVISIAKIRGRVRGLGSEFVLACDMRFGSREKAVFGQPEVGAGVIPGGGALEWLPRLVGRSRTLEIARGSDDYNADTAQLYGWINRAVADAELDRFVDAFARRIAGFDRFPLMQTKTIINTRAGLPTIEELADSGKVFGACLARPETQRRVGKLMEAGLQQVGETELNLGKAVVSLKL
ncbi:hypothetical protein ACQRIT_004812 [Beauveria bassiana]